MMLEGTVVFTAPSVVLDRTCLFEHARVIRHADKGSRSGACHQRETQNEQGVTTDVARLLWRQAARENRPTWELDARPGTA
jgi:hypothetical protein